MNSNSAEINPTFMRNTSQDSTVALTTASKTTREMTQAPSKHNSQHSNLNYRAADLHCFSIS